MGWALPSLQRSSLAARFLPYLRLPDF